MSSGQSCFPHEMSRDGTLSSAAKAVFMSINSHAPDYDLTVQQIVNEVAEAYDTVNAAIKELEKRGYLKRTRRRNPNGSLAGYDWQIIYCPGRQTP